MKKLVFEAALAALVGSAVPAAAAPIVYTVNAQAGDNAVTGTITTDGKIGVLAESDITSYLLQFTRAGGGAVTADSAQGPNYEIIGDAFTASATDLFFDYSSTTPNAGFYFADEPGVTYFCSNADGGFGCGDSGSNELAIGVTFNTNSVSRSGVQSISNAAPAGAVPEPASWAMMLCGFGLVGSSIRRRRVGVSFTQRSA